MPDNAEIEAPVGPSIAAAALEIATEIRRASDGKRVKDTIRAIIDDITQVPPADQWCVLTSLLASILVPMDPELRPASVGAMSILIGWQVEAHDRRAALAAAVPAGHA